MRVWRNYAQTTLMNKTLRRTDQGDVSSFDWLDRKGIRGIRLGCWNPHQSTSLLLTTTPPTTMFTSSHTEANARSLWNPMDRNTSYLQHGTFHFWGRYQGRTCKRFDTRNHSTNAIGGGVLGYPTNQQVGESPRSIDVSDTLSFRSQSV